MDYSDLLPSRRARRREGKRIRKATSGWDWWAGELGRAADRVTALRKAFMDTMVDREFRAEVEQAKFETRPSATSISAMLPVQQLISWTGFRNLFHSPSNHKGLAREAQKAMEIMSCSSFLYKQSKGF